jgi:hypothetical protein
MELTPGRQRLFFAVVVILLALLGIYLVGPGRSHGAASAASASTAPANPAVTVTPSPLGVPSAVAAPTPVAVTPVKGANIYNWLPFTQQDLSTAAGVTLAFAAADESFSYTDTAATYAARLSGLVTPDLGQTLESQFAPPGAQQQRVQQHLVSKSSGSIVRITSFGTTPQTSITFVVDITVQTTASAKTTSVTNQWAVTAVTAPGGWAVHDIEPATAGNS